MNADDAKRHDMTPDGSSPDRDADLEALFARCAPAPADPRTVDRLAELALDRIQKRVRTRRTRGRAMVAAAVAAAALVVVAWWPRAEVVAPSVSPRVVTKQPERSEPVEPPVVSAVVPDAAPTGAPSPVVVVDRALETTITLRASRREILRELRRGGPEVVERLLLALRSAEEETSLAAAQLLASLATGEADAETRRVLQRDVADADAISAKTAEALVQELLRRRDRAGRRLVRSLLETPPAGAIIVRLLGEERSPRAAELLGEASGSPSIPLSSEAIALLSRERPRRAAAAFWRAAESFAASSPPAKGAETEASKELTDFLREALPRLSTSTLAQLEDDLRRRSPFADDGAWRATLAASLGRSESREAWPLLGAIVETGGARPADLRTLGALGDVRAVPVLERYVLLEDDRAEAAIRALAEIPGPAGVRALLKAYLALGSPGRRLPSGGDAHDPLFSRKRTLLASALLRDRGARCMAELRSRLSRLPDQPTLDALIELFPGSASEELARLIPNVDRRGQHLVFRALARLGTGAAITILIDSLEDPSFRSLARQSLTAIAHRDLGSRPESWREWLRDQDPDSRRRADFRPGPRGREPLHGSRTGASPVLALKTHAHRQRGSKPRLFSLPRRHPGLTASSR